MKGGVTKRIDETIAALERGQLKNALYLTDRPEMARARGWVEEAARKALADKKNARKYMNEAKDKLQATITLPLDDTSMEGVEEYLSPKTPTIAVPIVETTSETPSVTKQPTEEMTDEEMYENCEDCHIAAAAAAAADICEEHPQTICTIISERLDKEDTQPEDWIKALREAAAKSEGEAKAKLDVVMDDLRSYLQRRNSPFLKAWKENTGGQPND
jgi:hypothetical protein